MSGFEYTKMQTPFKKALSLYSIHIWPPGLYIVSKRWHNLATQMSYIAPIPSRWCLRWNKRIISTIITSGVLQ